MTWKRILVIGILLCVQSAMGPAHLAQETEETADEPAAGDPEVAEVEQTVDTPSKSERRFALYVEAAMGSVAAEEINTSISTSSSRSARGFMTLDDNVFGRAVIGWQLPKDKGHFLLRFEGYKEDSYESSTVGSLAVANDTNGDIALVKDPVPWWFVTVVDGEQVSVEILPTWDTANDPNGNFVPDFGDCDLAPASGVVTCGEIFYDTDNPAVMIVKGVPKDLQNRLQTVDALYRREFGGRLTRGRWDAGLRYFAYEGNVPAAAWLNTVGGTASPAARGAGFTAGELLPMINFAQDTSGFGPTAALEIQRRLFRDRLVVYGEARSAFVVQTLEANTGDFFTLARDPVQDVYLSAPANLTDDRNKSSWHVGMELGVRVELLDGFHLNLAYTMTSFQDVVLMPTAIVIPENSGQIAQGASGIFKSQDLKMDGWFGGLSFQF